MAQQKEEIFKAMRIHGMSLDDGCVSTAGVAWCNLKKWLQRDEYF